MTQVSVVVLTYNPDPVKLRQTLTAAARQTGVQTEIVISDDGSTQKDFSFLPGFMGSLSFENYRLLEHRENRGTVRSCLDAVSAATGEYVFLTSPGDLLYDDHTLEAMVRFSQDHSADLCFGNAVFYGPGENGPHLTREKGCPSAPQLYDPGASSATGRIAFFGGNWVIGASYFRKRALLLETLRQICDTSKYMEDTPTTAFALAAGHRLFHCNRNIVWYEDGTGVSTGNNDKWAKLLHQDALLSFQKLKGQYPKDPYVDITCRNLSQPDRKKRILGNLLRHPVLMSRLLLCKRAKAAPITCSQEALAHLKQLLEIQ